MNNCNTCEAQPRDHSPMKDEVCHLCDQVYFSGCKREHHHAGYAGCYDGYSDIRECPYPGCWLTVHKDCAKDGSAWRVHESETAKAPGTAE